MGELFTRGFRFLSGLLLPTGGGALGGRPASLTAPGEGVRRRSLQGPFCFLHFVTLCDSLGVKGKHGPSTGHPATRALPDLKRFMDPCNLKHKGKLLILALQPATKGVSQTPVFQWTELIKNVTVSSSPHLNHQHRIPNDTFMS